MCCAAWTWPASILAGCKPTVFEHFGSDRRETGLTIYRRLVTRQQRPGAVQSGLGSREPFAGSVERVHVLVDLLLAAAHSVRRRAPEVFEPIIKTVLAPVESLLSPVQPGLANVGGGLALVRDSVALVANPVPVVGESLPPVGY